MSLLEPLSGLRLRPLGPSDAGWALAVFAQSQPALDVLASLCPPAEGHPGLGANLVAMQFEARRRHHEVRWPDAQQQVIERLAAAPDGRARWVPVGTLWTHAAPQRLHLIDLALLPAWRGQGLGTRCLEALLEAAARAGHPMTLQVALDNPARGLYERLGFVPDGEADGVHLPMICRPRVRTLEEPDHEQA